MNPEDDFWRKSNRVPTNLLLKLSNGMRSQSETEVASDQAESGNLEIAENNGSIDGVTSSLLSQKGQVKMLVEAQQAERSTRKCHYAHR